MKGICRLLGIGALVLLGSAAAAHAATISYSDTFDPTDVLFNASGGACTGTNGVTDTVSGTSGGSCDTLTYTQVLQGYSNPPDSLVSALLRLWFYDDTDPSSSLGAGNPESVVISLNGIINGGEMTITNNGASTFPIDVLAQVDNLGNLAVLLSRGATGSGQNDFYFDKSVLDAQWTESETPPTGVPEPATILLMGGGAAAAAWRRYRQHATSR